MFFSVFLIDDQAAIANQHKTPSFNPAHQMDSVAVSLAPVQNGYKRRAAYR
jgi:hypothetical protein